MSQPKRSNRIALTDQRVVITTDKFDEGRIDLKRDVGRRYKTACNAAVTGLFMTFTWLLVTAKLNVYQWIYRATKLF